MMTKCSIAVLIGLVLAVHAFGDIPSTDGFDRYQGIIEKSPFRKGERADDVQPGKPIVESLKLGGLLSGNAIKRVWITDIKTGKNYYLGEGDMVLDYQVTSIDSGSQTVLLRRGGSEERLAFSGNSLGAQVTGNAVRPAPSPQAALRGRVLRQQVKPVTPSAEGHAQPAEDTKEADARHEQASDETAE